jgi:thioredoxin reductase/SAM-dependent methyltransferase
MAEHDEVRDAVIVGGGAAGLSAALTLARARRRVTVVDAGEPRNAPADGVHGLLALDGLSPAELLARGRGEVLGYGGEIVEGEVVDVSRAPYGFRVVLRDGDTLRARRLLIATGLVDELPDIPGVREQWGHGVLHCPYCHGWEVRDRWIGVLATGPMSVHQALMFRQWSASVGFFAGDQELAPDDRSRLEARDIMIVEGPISRLEVDEDRVTGVRLADGRLIDVDVAVVSPRMVARAEPFAGIGVEPTPHPTGSFIESDATGRTSVPGVWVAGNASDLSAQVSAAAAEGARAAQQINADLVMEDTDTAVSARDRSRPTTHSFDKDYWDQHWQGDGAAAPVTMAVSPPNPHLVREVGDLEPGTALDAGCGAGAEATWLASRGWQVAGADIADRALARAAERAAASGVADRVRWVLADLSDWEPGATYDLVTTHYAHPAMPQLEFYDRIASWVAPGGTLLIVGHLHHDHHGSHDHGHDHGAGADGEEPPASASVTAVDITARLDPTVWEVVTAEESHRTMRSHGRGSATLHDVVVRAIRRR